LNSPTIFETREGLLGSVIKIGGVAFVTELPETLNAFSRSLHQALTHLDERFICYVTLHRKKETVSLEGDFSSRLAKRINDKYHQRFNGQNLFKNHIYLTMVLKGDTSNMTAKLLNKARRILDLGYSTASSERRCDNADILRNTVRQVQSSLSKFHPTLLGDKDQGLGFSELIEFLSLIPNGGDTLRFKHPDYCPPISKNLPQTFLDEDLYPDGHLGQYVCNKRLLFGDTIQLQGAALHDQRFAAILSVKQYGNDDTGRVMLDPLLSLNSEFISTHSFVPLPRDVALKTINLKRGKLVNAGDLGASQIRDLKCLEDDIASERARMGFHHNTIMLIAPDKSVLQIAINDTVKAYSNVGMVVVNETLGAESAFFAQIPGNHAHIARASLITSRNFVDFCALHNYQTGFKDGNHLGSAVTLLETPSKTPVFFNYHTKGTATNPAKGHAAIFGGNDSGKTTFVAFMDSQLGRYGGRSFFLDRNQSSRIYILGYGNSRYTTIAPDYASQCQMNPLLLPDSEENRTFLKIWLASLVKKEDEIELPGSIGKFINNCIDYNFEQLDRPWRTLSNIARLLPVDFPRWDELKRWLKGNEFENDGEYAWIFDNDRDALELDFDRVGFDVTWLMEQVTHVISTPVYLYIVHRMRQSLDGRLTTITIEEAFQVFRSPFWVSLLDDWLPTIRKANGHIVFLTQSPQTVINSSISATVLDNVATTILFPNPKADKRVATS
jgi:type IV secretion system protein VirB4